MELSEANFVFTTKIQLGEIVENPAFKNEWIELREPDDIELAKATNGDDNAKASAIRKLLPKCIIHSSFTSNGAEASGEAVAELICKSATTYTKVTNAWLKACPFPSQTESTEN